MVRVAIDGMGGDRAPRVVIEGIARIVLRYPKTVFIIFGHAKKIESLLKLKRFKKLRASIEIVHTDEAIAMHESPATAIRRGGKSSMALALKAVKAGKADCMVSAGNTGALMGMAKIYIKTVEG